jgi:hypothetical protein
MILPTISCLQASEQRFTKSLPLIRLLLLRICSW